MAEQQNKEEIEKMIRQKEAELENIEEQDDKFKSADMLQSLGVLYHQSGDYLKAQDYYQKALPIYQELGKDLEVGQIFHLIGGTYEQMGQFAKARNFYYESLHIGEKINANLLLGEVNFRIANLASQRGDTDLAVEYFNKSIDLSKKVGYLVGHNNAFRHLAMALEKKGDIPAAVESYIEALDFSDLDEEPVEFVAKTYDRIVDLLEKQEETERAVEYQRKLVTFCEDRNLPETAQALKKLDELEKVFSSESGDAAADSD